MRLIRGFGKSYWSLIAVQAYASAIKLLNLFTKSQYHKFHHKCLPLSQAPPCLLTLNHNI